MCAVAAADPTCPCDSAPLLDSILIYVTRPDLLASVRRFVESNRLGREIEYRIGALCREELLVEIEGIKRLEGGNVRP